MKLPKRSEHSNFPAFGVPIETLEEDAGRTEILIFPVDFISFFRK